MRFALLPGLLALVLSACTASDSISTSSPATPTASPSPSATLLPDEAPPRGAGAQFTTDFSRHSVPYSEILSGGPPKDGIPAIDEPQFTAVDEANTWLKPQEPVILLQVGDDARAYPIQILMWHEIVNDSVGGAPVIVTFCPLCNTAIAFERKVDGQVLDFGTTGRLYFSNLIMYDRQTESWWQQATGEAIVGEFTGRQLAFIPAPIISWVNFKAAHPGGKVLSRETGYSRDYGRNPYAGYDDVNRSPFLYDGPLTPDVLLPMARVVTVDLNGEAVAYPYDVLQDVHVVNDIVGGVPVVVLWAPGTASALDAGTVDGGRDVGAVTVLSRELGGQTLTFVFEDGQIVDERTGNEWSVLGQAMSGPQAGSQLTPVVSINHFWFSWAAFKPETRVYQPSLVSPPPTERAADADVLHVRAVQAADGTWTFHVTVQHPDTGWENYADGWDVLTPDGMVIKPDPDSPFTRLLLHPHVSEQPFTRSQSGILIPPGVTQVRVRAHDGSVELAEALVDGYGGREVLVDLTVSSGPDFEVEREP